jgi:uncharacterized protein YbaP (TraB family)
MHLVGAVHAGTAALELPDPVRRAAAAAQVFAFENAPGAYTPEEQARLGAAMSLPAGVRLRPQLEEGLRARFEAACQGNGIDPALLDGYHPAAAAMVLGMMQMRRQGLDPALGVEARLLALRGERPLVPLEPADAALAAFTGMPERVGALILDTASSDADGKRQRQAYDAYLAQDQATLERILAEATGALAAADAALVQRVLVVERNARMTAVLVEMLKDARPSLAVIGVAHLLGEDSIPAGLAAKGFRVVRVGPDG